MENGRFAGYNPIMIYVFNGHNLLTMKGVEKLPSIPFQISLSLGILFSPIYHVGVNNSSEHNTNVTTLLSRDEDRVLQL